MRIAFLCKRRYTGNDVISHRYGRLYQFPYQLARLGHVVRGYCLDYHHSTAGEWTHADANCSLTWEARALGKLRLPGAVRYPRHMLDRLRRFAPDLLFGASDIPHVILTAWLARRLGIPYAVDLYDNFESFRQARVPGIVGAFKRSVRGAGIVTVVSDPLRQKVEVEYAPRGTVRVLGNAIDREAFRPGEKASARRILGLPHDAYLIGTAGGLSRAKGVSILCEAWNRLAGERSDIHLVLAGPIEPGLLPLWSNRVHYVGHLPPDSVADVFNALDVGVITLRDDEFGRYCYPQKLQEMLACGLPVVAADVGVMRSALKHSPQLLYRDGDSCSLAAAILRQLEERVMPPFPLSDWSEMIGEIEPELSGLHRDSKGHSIAPHSRLL